MTVVNRTTMAAGLEMWDGTSTDGLPELLAPAYRGHVLEADGHRSVSHGMNVSRFDAAGRLDEEWAIWSAWQDLGEEATT